MEMVTLIIVSNDDATNPVAKFKTNHIPRIGDTVAPQQGNKVYRGEVTDVRWAFDVKEGEETLNWLTVTVDTKPFR